MSLTTLPLDSLLDLDPWVGQRSASFRFELTNGVTGERLGDLHPTRGASLSHDTSRTIKRSMNLALDPVDTAAINVITDRVDPFMVFPTGQEFPLGRYVYAGSSRQVFTAGRLSANPYLDEMFLVDQQISAAINANGKNAVTAILETVAGLPIAVLMEASPYTSVESWGIGTGRGQVLESLSVTGDFFSPWFGNDKKMHFIRSFDPTARIPDFDFDAGNKVQREPIMEDDDLTTAPNRVIVISNAPENSDTPVVGIADVPPSAPHSIVNRGFAIPNVIDLQLRDNTQAAAVAQGLVQRQTLFERVNLATAPDPRHDSYNVVKWRDELWLEIAWSIQMIEGGDMSHLLRKAYTS